MLHFKLFEDAPHGCGQEGVDQLGAAMTPHQCLNLAGATGKFNLSTQSWEGIDSQQCW